MKNTLLTLALTALLTLSSTAVLAAEDKRQWVEMPPMMQAHMLANMRDHLVAINEIIAYIAADELDKAGEVAEERLGMSSLDNHHASHMAKFMPEGMRETGTAMHKAASRFAVVATEGEVQPALKALSDVTSACIACHASYRIR